MTTKTKNKPKAKTLTNVERQRIYRLKHDKPMSLSPKMTDARIGIVVSTWTPAAMKRVQTLLNRAAAK